MRKLSAGALQLTMHIVIVVALLLMAFVLLVHLRTRFKLESSFVKETIDNCDKAINYALKNRLVSNDTITIEFEDADYKSLKVHKTFWGAFEQISVISKIKTHQFKKTALVGGSQLDIDRPSLFLEDTKTPLVIVGNAKLEGVAYLPAQGVKPGYISGVSYNGTSLIYGDSKVISSFPKPSSEWLEYIGTIHFTGTKVNNRQFLRIESGNSYSNSFVEPTQVIYENGKIDLNFVSLTGNIIVQSQSEIVVGAYSDIRDVLLIAPKISIEDNVKGHFQAIASKTITVGENVNLYYPSSLIVNEKGHLRSSNSTDDEPNIPIEIASNSTVLGQVVFNGLSKTNNFTAQVYISDNTTVIGEVYCNQNLELLGTVRGTVFAHNFEVHKSGSVYQNHIYNGKILISELPEAYVGIMFNDSQKAVAKWLY